MSRFNAIHRIIARNGGGFQLLEFDSSFLTAKYSLMPLKYVTAIDLTCDVPRNESFPCGKSVLQNGIAKLLRAKNAHLAR